MLMWQQFVNPDAFKYREFLRFVSPSTKVILFPTSEIEANFWIALRPNTELIPLLTWQGFTLLYNWFKRHSERYNEPVFGIKLTAVEGTTLLTQKRRY